MKRILGVLAFVSLLCVVAGAQGSSVGSSQLKNPLDARVAGVGEATVADAGRFSSWLLNPANLSTDSPTYISLSHSQWFQDVRSEFLGIQLPLSRVTLGVGIATSSVPGIEIRETPGPATGTFDARFLFLQTGVALNLGSGLQAGASVKYLYEKLFTNNATGVGADVGILYSPGIRGVQLAASVTNFGNLREFRSERSDLPTFLRAGGTYSLQFSELSFSGSLAVSNGLQRSESHFHAGAEASYDNTLWLRLGYVSGFDARALTAGFGLRYKFLTSDYAYIPFSFGLGDAHILSIGVQL